MSYDLRSYGHIMFYQAQEVATIVGEIRDGANHVLSAVDGLSVADSN